MRSDQQCYRVSVAGLKKESKAVVNRTTSSGRKDHHLEIVALQDRILKT